jgi:hypothetical protein
MRLKNSTASFSTLQEGFLLPSVVIGNNID